MPFRYDPDRNVDADVWLALDELERIEAVREYHSRNKIRLPNVQLHATVHTIVENQIALGAAIPAQSVLARLMAEGLDRHEAVHAIGAVLSEQMNIALGPGGGEIDLNARYFEKLSRLTANAWRTQTY